MLMVFIKLDALLSLVSMTVIICASPAMAVQPLLVLAMSIPHRKCLINTALGYDWALHYTIPPWEPEVLHEMKPLKESSRTKMFRCLYHTKRKWVFNV